MLGLDLGEKDERYLVSFIRRTDHQWELRYTSREAPERTMQECGSLCGDIAWGSSARCLAVHIDYITGPSSILLATNKYPIVVVDYASSIA